VLRSALAQGLSVASLSRSGVPAAGTPPELSDVEWLKGDVLAGDAPLREAMKGCDAVISCLGAFGSNEFMHQINGAANASLAEVASEQGVDRFVFISAAEIRPVASALAAAGYEGYYGGKITAETAVTEHFGDRGLILRPGPIFGTRKVSPSISIPIGAVGVPLTTIFETSPVRALAAALPMQLGDLIMPWVSVEDVADAAVSHVVEAGGDEGDVGGKGGSGGEAAAFEWEAMRKAASQMRFASAPEVSLFWDGGCPLCTTEIGYYKRIDAERRVDWIDLTTSVERLEAAGIAREDAVALIHAIDHKRSEEPLIGVPAFMAVWDRLPSPWNALPPIMRAVPHAVPVVEMGYRFWAKHRLKLTGRARALDKGSTCEEACELKSKA